VAGVDEITRPISSIRVHGALPSFVPPSSLIGQIGLLLDSPSPAIIPSPKPSRRPANIPLRTLPRPGSPSSQDTALLREQSDEKQGRRSSLSRSSSPSSDLSWSDTGDLALQLGEEDPLQLQLRESLDEHVFGRASRRGSRPRRVRYHEDTGDTEDKEYHRGIVKEDIPIPNPAPRTISRAEQTLAAIMSGGERQMHGLTGRPLV